MRIILIPGGRIFRRLRNQRTGWRNWNLICHQSSCFAIYLERHHAFRWQALCDGLCCAHCHCWCHGVSNGDLSQRMALEYHRPNASTLVRPFTSTSQFRRFVRIIKQWTRICLYLVKLMFHIQLFILGDLFTITNVIDTFYSIGTFEWFDNKFF